MDGAGLRADLQVSGPGPAPAKQGRWQLSSRLAKRRTRAGVAGRILKQWRTGMGSCRPEQTHRSLQPKAGPSNVTS